MCCGDDPGTRIRVAQPCGQVSNKAVHAFNPLGTVDVVERGINLREIPDMWTVQNRCAQLGGLDGVLTAVSDQRATDKHHWGQTIDKAKLANSVGDIDFCLVLGQFPERAERARQTGRGRDLGNTAAALRMARRDHGQQSGKIAAQSRMRLDYGFLFTGMGRRGCDHRPVGDRILQFRERCWFGGRRRRVELEVAGRNDVWCAKIAQARCVGRSAS